MNRRVLMKLLVVGGAGVAAVALAGPKVRRKIRRRVRRKVRRRIRRRVLWRTVGARRALVVPLALAVGWELALDNRVVVVHEVKPEVIVVIDPTTNKKEEIAVVKEDDAENAKDLQGTALAATDTTSPAKEAEEEIEEEVDE